MAAVKFIKGSWCICKIGLCYCPDPGLNVPSPKAIITWNKGHCWHRADRNQESRMGDTLKSPLCASHSAKYFRHISTFHFLESPVRFLQTRVSQMKETELREGTLRDKAGTCCLQKLTKAHLRNKMLALGNGNAGCKSHMPLSLLDLGVDVE